MDSLKNSILNLSTKRPIFHSEHDLKLSLALTIKENNPELQIRLERPIDIEMLDRNNKKVIVRAPIDIVIIDHEGSTIPIELKYKTKKVEAECDGEKYLLTDHGATDVGRYSFRKDLYRIERYLSQKPDCKIGVVLILTNDQAYFETNVFQKGTIDKHFSVHHGGTINRLDNSWNYTRMDLTKYRLDETENMWRFSNQSKMHWTCKKEHFYKLDLLRDYQVEWENYSVVKNSAFRYCLFEVKR